MRDDLLLYYERELDYLRKMGMQFAAKNPKVASRLVLEPTKCEDPHVERILEAFAFLAARVHLKIDDEIPEISEGLLTSTVTPGRTAPEVSRTVPAIVLVWADAAIGNSARQAVPRMIRADVLMPGFLLQDL